MVQSLRFSADELQWLARSGHFCSDFVEHLAAWRFTGDIHAMPEGTVIFPDEPILRVTAPLPEAQFVESRIINLLHFQTMIASKAVRSVLAARGSCSWISVFAVRMEPKPASWRLGRRIWPVSPARPQWRPDAISAFRCLARWPTRSCRLAATTRQLFCASLAPAPTTSCCSWTLLIQKTEARAAVRLAPTLAREGITIKSVRIDSGDLAAHARAVRKILDDGGLQQVTIFASGGLDEEKLAELVAARAPIDGFGVGTALDVSADAPYMDCAYKLVEYAGRPTAQTLGGQGDVAGSQAGVSHARR